MIKKHAVYSASASHRWLKCPGSIKLSEKAPPAKSSIYADEGTQAHSCLEDLLKGSPLKAVQKKYPREMVEHALDAWHVINDTKENAKGSELLCETFVSNEFIHKDMFGTLDAAVVEEFGTLYVFDYKYGSTIVEPTENPQLIAYALGLAHKYDYNFADVALTIIQPRAEHSNGTTRSYMMSIESLKEWGNIFKLAIQQAETKNAPLKAGDHCRWCPAATICPEISKVQLQKAQAVFSPKTGAVTKLPEPYSIEREKLGDILDSFELIEHWIKAVRAHVFHVLGSGQKVKGWKLVPKRSIRKWTNEEDALKNAKKLFGEKVLEINLFSPARFEKTIGDKEFLDSYCSSISSGFTLASESDKRQAIDAIQNAFGN